MSSPMTGTEPQVEAAVAQTMEPLVGRQLDELGLVEAVRTGRRGTVEADVRGLLSEAGYRRALETSVGAAVRRVDGVRAVEVDVRPLEDGGRSRLAQQLRSENRRPGGLGSPTRVYAVGSGKGGVGKSALTANLAVALARSGQRVGVLDADVWGYSVPQLFGVREAPVALKGLMLPVSAHGVRLMSVGFFVDDQEPIVWRGPMLRKALEQFLDDVYWGELDALLVDLPPGTGDVPMTLLELLPDASLLVVTTPQRAAEQVAARVGRMALDARMPVAGVIENMTGAAFGSGGGVRLAEMLGAPLLGQVPLDESLCEAGDAGVPQLAVNPEAPSAVRIRAVADALPAVRPSLVGKALPLFVG